MRLFAYTPWIPDIVIYEFLKLLDFLPQFVDLLLKRDHADALPNWRLRRDFVVHPITLFEKRDHPQAVVRTKKMQGLCGLSEQVLFAAAVLWRKRHKLNGEDGVRRLTLADLAMRRSSRRVRHPGLGRPIGAPARMTFGARPQPHVM
ncbi:hypothetical protein HAP48_0042295 [Bradyrhizobium septentrionale]|uniref:Uncharacterized protein n=1 Tax=Bradyrhizobium septentrionale TaxID=1404411 RepID=A0A973W2D6_9BRAD|nr:hypothetical protein [Bradyrhizobium septentrionale]UGY15090.1 hypothetical protein HAP48_0042295 [Bradyrhizobium septentrionale]